MIEKRVKVTTESNDVYIGTESNDVYIGTVTIDKEELEIRLSAWERIMFPCRKRLKIEVLESYHCSFIEDSFLELDNDNEKTYRTSCGVWFYWVRPADYNYCPKCGKSIRFI